MLNLVVRKETARLEKVNISPNDTIPTLPLFSKNYANYSWSYYLETLYLVVAWGGAVTKVHPEWTDKWNEPGKD
jgi:hypothetical protein